MNFYDWLDTNKLNLIVVRKANLGWVVEVENTFIWNTKHEVEQFKGIGNSIEAAIINWIEFYNGCMLYHYKDLIAAVAHNFNEIEVPEQLSIEEE
jgi:hypothetical protein